jgi:3-hydroxy-9,10-secoandrosta-1,3,5(10)-triene-9,17-dione monooxygenase reductase component
MANEAASPFAAFALIDREVWIVTSQHAGRRGGLSATWVSLASLDPQQPVVVAGLAPNHFTTELVQASGCFGLHLVRPSQAALALNFALGSGRDRDKFAGLAVTTGKTGAPLLDDCLARFECRVANRYDTGDRTYFWADVVEGEQFGIEPPLREQALIAAANPEQKRLLAENRRADADLLRALHDQWRSANLFRP